MSRTFPLSIIVTQNVSDNRGNTMDAIKQPNPLDLSGNISENWKKFYQKFQLYMDASGLAEKGDKQKIALLLHVAQKQASYRSVHFQLHSRRGRKV